MKDVEVKKIKGFSSAYPSMCDLKLLPNIDGTWITIQDDVGTSMTIKLSNLIDFICLNKEAEQTEWIPVSEGLPKIADCYAVTRQIGSDLIVDACFFDGINTWHNDNRINHERNYLTNIIAWAPLPEPYDPQEREE